MPTLCSNKLLKRLAANHRELVGSSAVKLCYTNEHGLDYLKGHPSHIPNINQLVYLEVTSLRLHSTTQEFDSKEKQRSITSLKTYFLSPISLPSAEFTDSAADYWSRVTM